MENCSTGSVELQQDSNSVSSSSDVVSSEMTRLLYIDVGCRADVCTRINPPGLIARQNLWKSEFILSWGSATFIDSMRFSILGNRWLTLNHPSDGMLAKWPGVPLHPTPTQFGHQPFAPSPPSSNRIDVDPVVAFYIWTNRKRIQDYIYSLWLPMDLLRQQLRFSVDRLRHLSPNIDTIECITYLRRSWAMTSLLVVSHWMPSVLYSMSRRKHAVNTLIVVCNGKEENGIWIRVCWTLVDLFSVGKTDSPY